MSNSDNHFPRYPLLICLFACFCSEMAAQRYVDLFRLSYSSTPENDFDTSLLSTRLTEVSGEFTFPKPITSRLTLINGVNYEMVQASVLPGQNPVTVHGIMLRTGLSVVHSDRLNGNYFFLPKLSSDLKKIGRRDWQFGFLALFKKRKSENFIWQYGALLNTELFGPFAVPLLGFYYKSPTRKLEMNFLLPASADMNYALGDRIHAGLQFISMVKSFHLRDEIPQHPSSYWVKSTNELFGYLQLRVGHSWLIQGRVGQSVFRRYYAYDVDDRIDFGVMAFKFGDNRQKLNPFFEDGMIFQFRFIYRFDLPENKIED